MASRSSGRRPHPLKLQGPVGERQPDGDGEYTQEFATYSEPFGSVEPATAQRLEKLAVSATLGSASHIVVIPFDGRVQLQHRVIYAGRRLDVVGYADPDERHVELVIVCQEIKP